MSKLLDSFWRAVLYCLHPRVILLSLVPVIAMVAVWLMLGSVYLDDALRAVRTSLESHELLDALIKWLEQIKLQGAYQILVAVLLQCLMVPAVVLVTLLFVALLMTPAMVRLVSGRRFPQLERKKGGNWRARLSWWMDSIMPAIVALVLSVPMWLVPPLILILPSLIWGWLTYRVMSHGALAGHATPQEFAELFKAHQGPLLAIGMLSGYLGTVPGVLWISAAIFEGALWLLAAVAIWTYTLVFAFSSLWFVHYCLAALEQQRQKKPQPAPKPAAPTLTLVPSLTMTQTPTPTLTLTLAPAPPAPPPPAAAPSAPAPPPAR